MGDTLLVVVGGLNGSFGLTLQRRAKLSLRVQQNLVYRIVAHGAPSCRAHRLGRGVALFAFHFMGVSHTRRLMLHLSAVAHTAIASQKSQQKAICFIADMSREQAFLLLSLGRSHREAIP